MHDRTDTAPPVSLSDAPSDRRRWIALAVVLTAALMDLVDVTIVNVAIPAVQRDLGASYSAVQWITEGYVLAFALGLISGGRLGDIYGRRRLFLFGVAGFTVASALCGASASSEMLIAARVLQGAMAALMVPQVLAIIHVTFPPSERGRVFGMYGGILGAGAIAGPILGGILTQADLFGLGWRSIFLINVPLGVAGLALGCRYLTESTAAESRRLDPTGMALATAGLLLLLFPLTQGREHGWPVWGFVLMAAALPVLAGFAVHQRALSRRGGAPLVEPSLFKARSFTAGVTVELLFSTATGLFFLAWILYLQLGLGYSPLRAGLTGIPFSVGVSAAAAVSVQVLVPRFGRKVIQAGVTLMALGILGYLWEAQHFSGGLTPWQMIPPLTVMGLGMGLVLAPLTDLVLSGVPHQHAGSASGVFNTVQQLAQAMGIALASVFFFALLPAGSAHGHASSAGAQALVEAFPITLAWLAAFNAVALMLTFALPRQTSHPDPDPTTCPPL
ncbi:MFS transporter [Streptomyces sp. NPDC059396]|uniref:MFS transporter n=1 Tax=Streptomyces sp. NPDC059396 TaxID=3346819 RepID=UPI0036B079BA